MIELLIVGHIKIESYYWLDMNTFKITAQPILMSCLLNNYGKLWTHNIRGGSLWIILDMIGIFWISLRVL